MYYAENPDAAHDVHELRVELLGEKMTFLTDAGVFSKKMIDFGSQLLLRCLDVEKVKNSGCWLWLWSYWLVFSQVIWCSSDYGGYQ